MSQLSNDLIRDLNLSNLPEITGIHLKAFPKSALTQLGAETVRRYYDWQLNGPHEVVPLGIFQDDILLGFCFGGIFRGALSGFLRKNKTYLAWRVLTHPWLITNRLFRERLNLTRNLFSPTKKPNLPPIGTQIKTFGILSIAIDPRFQGRGLGKQLMLRAEQIALERGFSRMHLSVAQDNPQAIRFYEHAGWYKLYDADVHWAGHMQKEIGAS